MPTWENIFWPILKFASRKLQIVKLNKEEDEKTTSLNISAVVACRFGFLPKERTCLEELVASNMATLTNMDESRSILEVSYVPEPMLAEAAGYLMERLEYRCKMLKTLALSRQAGRLGILNAAGDVGEFLAVYCLQRTIDMCLWETKLMGRIVFYHRPVPVRQFLGKLKSATERDATSWQ